MYTVQSPPPPKRSIDLRITVHIVPQLEQLLRILPANLCPIRDTQLSIVKPRTCRLKLLKWVVHREQYPVRADLIHTKVECGRREVATCRDPDVLIEILANRLLAAQAKRLLDVLEPVVDAPQVKGDMLTQMAQNNLQLGVAIKGAVGHHAEHMQADALGKGQRWAHEPLAVLPQLLKDAACGVARVQVKGNVELRACLPKDVPFGLVVKDHVVTVGASALGVVDEGALEAVGGHAPAELSGCFFGVMHGESTFPPPPRLFVSNVRFLSYMEDGHVDLRKSTQTILVPLDLAGHVVVDLHRQCLGFFRVGDVLHTGCCVG